jgi:hypothetical protein
MKNCCKLSVALLVVTFFAGCGNDVVTEQARLSSPNGYVDAVYTTYSYGGAAGGVGHCVTIEARGSEHADRKLCELLGSHMEGLALAWRGDVLVIRYSGGDITAFSNATYLPGPGQKMQRYEIELSRQSDAK